VTWQSALRRDSLYEGQNMHVSEALQSDTSAAGEAWPKIDLGLLDERHDTPPTFPLEVLPSFWRSWAQAATASSGAPADYVALSLLTAAASLIPGRWVMPAPGWAEPCILWTALVGPPSCGKTPAVEAACRLLNAVWYQRCRGPQNPDGPVTPAPMLTNGTSIGAILDKMDEAAPRGLLLVRDDNGGWLSHMARGTRDGSAHAFWLSAWCLRNLEFGWRGKTLELDRLSLSILGTTHPDTLLPALNRDDGGVLARFLFVRPAAAAPWEPLTRADAAAPEAVAALRRLYELPWNMRDLSLTGEAHAAFDGFRQAHRGPMPDLAGKAAAWWGKGPSQVLRLAGVLTFLDWAAQPPGTAEPDQVPAWALEAAVRLWRDYLWPHAQATFRIAGAGGERESRERQVLRWIRAKRLPEVSREQIRREALQQAVDAAGAERLIAALVEAGFLQPVEPAKGGRGRRRRRWHAHPDLLGAHPLGARPHPELHEGSSGALAGASAEGNLAPLDPRAAISASTFNDAALVAAAEFDTGAPSVSAIRASGFDTAMSAIPVQAQVDAVPDVRAIPASEFGDRVTAAQANPDAIPDVPAIPASELEDRAEPVTAAQANPDAIPDVPAIPASEFEDRPMPLTAARTDLDGAPAISAIPASDFDPAPAAAPPPATVHEPLRRPTEAFSAVPASEADSDAAAVQPVIRMADPLTAVTEVIVTAGRDGMPPRLNSKARRRLRRLEKIAHLRNPVASTRQGLVA
jgi:hypothetical protein